MNDLLRTLRARFEILDQQFRERSLRERVLLGATAAAVAFMAVDSLAIRPVESERERLDKSIRFTRQQVGALEAELRTLRNTTLSDEERRLADQIEQIHQQLGEIDRRLGEEIAALVPPDAIVSVLEEMLAGAPDLDLVSLESRPPERVGSKTSVDQAADLHLPNSALYRHGVRIELEGGFEASRDYLKRLEASRWHLLFDRLEVATQSYPTSRTTIDLHTISQQEEWIGV